MNKIKMSNLIESIKVLIENKELKDNFLKEFEKQINNLDPDKKETNYRKFIEDDDMLELFFDKFDYNFIQDTIIKYFSSSNINKDDISENVHTNIDKIFFKKSKEELDDIVKEKNKELVNTFGDLLQNHFCNSNYNQNSQLYLGLEKNIQALTIVFYICLGFISNKKYEEIKNLKNEFNNLFNVNGIYQYLAFKQTNDSFGKHLLMISLIALFVEDADRNIVLRKDDGSTPQYYLRQIYEFTKDIDEDTYKELLLVVTQDFGLTYKLLNKIESGDWINIEYKRSILEKLLKFKLIEDNSLVDFSILFSSHQEISEQYVQYITGIEIENKKIIDNLKQDEFVNDTINFLLYDENKGYLNDNDVSEVLTKILKDKLIKNIKVENNFLELYKKFINGDLSIKKLNLTFDEFGKQLISKIIENKNDKNLLYTLENIRKVLLEGDLKDFKDKIVSELINNIGNINFAEFNDIFKYIDNVKKETLEVFSGKIKTDYLNDMEKLKIYLELLKKYSRNAFKYDGLKENIKNKLLNEQNEDMKSIMKEILDKIR